jgi:RimJ/RimL family protein N-acetyltransferase
VSEAHGVVGGDIVEIGTITNPTYAKKGFSTNVCTRLIVEATKKGLHPLWSCNKDNIPSNKTAQRLGMQAQQEYVFHNIGKK